MNENPLPTLKAGDSHMESLIEAAIQGHADTRDAMRWLVRQLVPLQARAQVQCELEPYDAGLLNDFGGGNVEWWQDYIRSELGHAHDFYQSQIATLLPAQATQTEVTDFDLQKLWLERFTGPSHDPVVNYARSILALRPVQVAMADEQVDAFTVNGRLHWLGKRQLIRGVEAYYGITAQSKKEQA